jgi:glycosyltransferase involved in cell wall biosynthesis
MNIGVDATSWHNRRGYGRHARGLLNALVRLDTGNRYTLFVDSKEASDALPPQVEARLVSASAPAAVAASAGGRRSVGDMWRMSRALSHPTFDLLLFPTVYSYIPVRSRARKLLMIHDVIAETYPRLTLATPGARLLWRAKVALGRWQADAIVTVSEFSRQGLLARFGLAPERVFVVGEASDPIFRRLADPQLTSRLASLGITPHRRLIVYVGGFGPHKNLERLVEVFARLASRAVFSDTCLVLVGEHESEVFYSQFDNLRRQVEALNLAERVIFTGYLPDDELVVLLNLATVLVLPSLLEGFGLPAVEAAACGCPVVATLNSPLPRLLGDAGAYVDPTDADEIERALSCVLSSDALHQRMRDAALAASRLTWEDAAREMMAVIRQVMA